jgi:hypothetical protein
MQEIFNFKKTVHIPASVYTMKEFKFVHNSLEETSNTLENLEFL